MYTYAFCKTPTLSDKTLDGIAGAVQMITEAQLSAFVEPNLDLEAIQSQDDRLLKAVLSHDRVVRELFQHQTILPLRFGTQFASLESLQSHLRQHQAGYLAKLSQLENKAEYTLKLLPVEVEVPPTPPQATGKNYFLAKKQQYQTQAAQQQQRQAEWQQVMQAIGQVYPCMIAGEQADGEQRVYLLVDHREEVTLQQHWQHWQDLCSDWHLQLGEALPPYHFV
jgi:hypothetical protein